MLSSLLVFIFMSASSPALAEPKDVPPTFSVAIRETFDAWGVPVGADPGGAVLNKFQLSGTLSGDKIDLPGWSAHARVFRFDGQLRCNQIGDIQTADNLEAIPVTRLVEAWIARQWG